MTLPYMALFYVSWLVASLYKPIIVVTLVVALAKPSAFLYKCTLFATTVQYLALCNDKKWTTPKEDPSPLFADAKEDEIESKTIVFVRHGESTWNDTFNKGDRSPIAFVLNFVPNLLKSLAYEWYFFLTGQSNESWFYDSPLSEKGKGQAEGVRDYLAESLEYKTPKEKEFLKIMLGETPSQLVSSNLRRAISTMAIGFQDRLSKQVKGDTMLIASDLQEISRNPDANCITPARGKVLLSWTDPSYLEETYAKQIDTKIHTGNKPVDTNGLKRLQAFSELLFDETVIPKEKAVIVAGHSLWFRSFFRTYLPFTVEHVAKKKKIVNGGCVGFVLKRIKKADGSYAYMVDPKTITVLFKGF